MHKVLLLLIFILLSTLSQSQINDFELWMGSEINYDLTNKIDLSFEEEFRFFDNSTRLLEHLSEIQIGYSFYKWLKTSVSYRLSQENNWFDQFENQHRFTANARFRKKKKRFVFSYRIRYQHAYTNYSSSNTGKIPNRVLRNRLSIKYDIKNFKGLPFVEYEKYHPLSSENSFNKYEFTLGFAYPLSKNMDAEIEYSYRKQSWSDIPLNRSILAFAVRYDL
jgi:Protein of unknown function (DUF2490)